MTDKIKLYTSLPPRVKRFIGVSEVGPSYIAGCIDSWRRSGFEVVSLNSVGEIEELAEFGYSVEYRQVSAYRPTIRDFLTAILSSESAVAGITNSDVFIANPPEWAGMVEANSARGMILVERINLDPEGLRPTGLSCNGFDAFIFGTKPLSAIDLDCEFLFGQPWWDYWFPLAYAATGGRLMTIDAPVLFHLDHPQNWSQAQWLANARKTVKYFVEYSGRLPDDIVAQVRGLSRLASPPESELGRFSHWCFARLRAMAEPIPVAPRPDGGTLFPTLFGQFDNAVTRGLMGELNEARGRIIDLTAETTNLSAELNEAGGRIINLTGELNEALGRIITLPARSYDDIRYFSTILQIDDDENPAPALAEGFRILRSRRATLRYYFALNAWRIGRKYEAVRDAVRGRMPWRRQTDEIDHRSLKPASAEGAKSLAAVDCMINDADAGGRKLVGDDIVGFAQKKAEGTFNDSSGKPEPVEPDPASCRIEIAVLDAPDRRFVPELENPVGAKITHAQNFEDVMIARLFAAEYRGFYIDIGAGHPEFLSVTCHFYNQGWSGINVEPSLEFYPLLCAHRPNDTNLNCAVGRRAGRATFHEFPQAAENSTLELDVAAQIARTGQPSIIREVEVMRLADLCDMHVKGRAIDFMKIDVEGSELGVLQGADWQKYRPRLLIIEATAVNSSEENSATWEHILLESGYHKVLFDGLNNFYLREEDIELRDAFRLPPNVFDGFEFAEVISLRRQLVERETERLSHVQQIAELETMRLSHVQQIAGLETTRLSHVQQIAELEHRLRRWPCRLFR